MQAHNNDEADGEGMTDMAANGLDALAVRPVDRSLESALRDKIDGKAKPPGSLGRLEDLAVRIGLMRHSMAPRIERIDLFVFAGDHGLTEEGVSSYPAAVTVAMVNTFLAGGACVNALSATANVDIHVVDAGVAADLPPHARLIDAKVRHGSRNAAREPALTRDEVRAALMRGGELVGVAIDKGADAIAIGEMGIGNTAASSLIMHRLIPAPLAECIGVGAGQDDVGLARKRAAIERAAHRSAATAPLDVLAEFGGCEIVMMAGAVLGAAARQRPVLVDGFIASAAALAAVRLQPAALDYCIFAHRSAERGHAHLLQSLGAEPLFDLGMRLGEGSGAALAGPLVRAAARLLTDVADLADILAAAEA